MALKLTKDGMRERARRDPSWWVRRVLNDDLWNKQEEILLSVRDNRRTFVRSCNGAGKSFTAARVVLWFLMAHKGSVVITTAPTFRQVKRILWQEIRKAYKGATIDLEGKLGSVQLDMGEKWYAFGFSTDDSTSFQGIHAEHVLVVFDEGAGITPEIFEGADAVLTSDHCRFLVIGNPTDPAGPFAEGFKDPSVHKIKISAFDTPNLTKYGITLDLLREAKEKKDPSLWERKITGPMPFKELVTPTVVYDRLCRWGEDNPIFVSRIMGDFPEDSDFSLLPLSWIEAAQRRSLKPGAKDPRTLGVDVARSGGDETVIGLRHGPVFRILDARRATVGGKVRTTQTVTRIKSFMQSANYIWANEYGRFVDMSVIPELANIDGIGIGAGVVDGLAQDGIPNTDINVGMSASDKERFENLKAELYWGLRQRFEDGDIDIDPDDDELAGQLSNIRWEETPRGRIKIEPKDELKARGLNSPDRAESMMLAFGGGMPEVWPSDIPDAEPTRGYQDLMETMEGKFG